MSVPTRPSPDDIDIMSLFSAIRGALRGLIIATLVIGGLTYGVLSTIAPRYTSEAQVSIAAKSTNPFPGAREGGSDIAPRLDKEAVNTHVRSLMAPDLVRTVASQLQLTSRAEFNSEVGSIDLYSRMMRMLGLSGSAPGETAVERTLRTVYQRLDISAANESRFISIRFASSDPALAAAFANDLAETYRRGLVSVPVAEINLVVEALAPKVNQLRKELIAAESRVERFRAETDQFRSGAEKTPINDRRMQSLSDELIKVEAARSEAEARWNTARELARGGSAEVLPDVQKSPLIQNLTNQRVTVEREYAQAAAQLLSGHPRMRELSANLASVKRQIDSEVRKVVASLEKDFRAASLRTEKVAKQIEELKTKVVATSGNEVRLRALESEAQAKRTELERLQKQLEDNRTVVNIKQVPVEAQIISMAQASSIPTFPKKGPYTLLAMAATFLLGLAWIVFRELVSGAYGGRPSRAQSDEQVRRQPVVGERPALSAGLADPPAPTVGGQSSKALHSSGAPAIGRGQFPTMAEIASRIAEREGVTGAYRTVAFANPDQPVPADAVLDLAGQLAGRGQSVLVIDWDLSGAGILGAIMGRSAPGMADLVREEVVFEDVIQQLPGSVIQAIPPGRQTEGGRALLSSQRLNLVLDVLDEAYDQIIVVANYADARLIFAAIEGRFDAGFWIHGASSNGQLPIGEPGRLLGYDVEGIEIFDYLLPDEKVSSRIKPRGRETMGGSAGRITIR